MSKNPSINEQLVNPEIDAPRPVRRKRRRKWPMVLGTTGLAVALGAAAIGSGLLLPQLTVQAEDTRYSVVSLTQGALSDDVTSTGTIAMNGTATVTVPEGLTVKTVDVEAGETVSEGDALVTLDSASIQTKLKALNEELATINTELGDLSGDTMSSSITATVAGRVKVVYGRAGDDVATVMKQNGALMLLSVDGYMKIEVQPQTSVVQNEDVIAILPSGSELAAYVYAFADDGTATILVKDTTLAVGEAVTITDEDGNLVGQGTAEINNPLRVIGTGGTIKTVPNGVNTSVSKGSTLFTLKNLPISTEYSEKLQEREDCLAEIAEMQALSLDPTIKTEVGGIVKTVDIINGQLMEESAAITLTTRDSITLSASVDELDILKLSAGQTASVTVDAISGETFEGTITKISAQGTTSGNVTTYPVKIELNDDPRFLPGMSATATISTGESTSALLVPVAAINTSNGQSFVYVAQGGVVTVSESGDPGVKTYITTGLSNGEYAEVLSGLNPTDQVVVVKSAASSSASSASAPSGGGMMDMGGMMGGGNMGGGTPPSRS